MSLDAVVVGSGPNGLAAAIALAETGKSVLVLEASDRIGGGMRSAELTLPGFVHDICSAIHPLAIASPFFRSHSFSQYGLDWIQPEIPLAHPLSGDRAVSVLPSLDAMAGQFGSDFESYKRLLLPFCESSESLLVDVLAPFHLPKHPLLMARFGLRGVRSAAALMQGFNDEGLRGMFAGMAAHSIQPLTNVLTAAVGILFCVTAHSAGWPFPRRGSEQIAVAMQRHVESLGAKFEVNRHVSTLSDLPTAKVVLFDVSPRQFVEIAGEQLPATYKKKLLKFRHGPGSFKLDWALSGPIPWTADVCRTAGTVHVGGAFEEIAAAEQCVADGQPAEHPFVLVAQQSLFDSTRAPTGQHTGWAYCHVPNGCTVNMTDRIETQIERFAPGFRDLILARHEMYPTDLQHYNPNYVGGDISGGLMDLRQTFARPVSWLNPYRTPAKHLFLCSASTPPGAGVHGMCGWHAAQTALASILR